jgi:predicted RNA-binding Zn-ribbon protein involved in translation (DUF1610 family)
MPVKWLRQAAAGLDSVAVTIEPVALTPLCPECGDLWLPDDRERWRAYLTDDQPSEVAFYCPECAERDFG